MEIMEITDGLGKERENGTLDRSEHGTNNYRNSS